MQTKKITIFLISIFIVLSLSFSAVADGNDPDVTVSLEIPSVSAKSVVMLDAQTGQVVFENASEEKLPVSYLVKLMTLLLTAEAIDSGKISFETIVTTSAKANSMVAPQIWLNAGEKITVDELVKAITIGNANDACYALAEAVGGNESSFVAMMNNKATELGMKNTAFLNCTGIEAQGQYSTAYDIALLGKEIAKYDKLIPYMTTWMVDVRNGQTNLVNTNLLIKSYKGVTGMKVASSKEAGNCLVASVSKNNLYLICVMLGCSTPEQRFADAKTLFDYAFASNEYFEPKISPDALNPVNVKNGEKQKVDIICENRAGIVIPKGTSKDVESKIELKEFVDAPVKKGDIVGNIIFFDGDKLLFETNIIANQDVKKISLGYSMKKLLGYLLKL